MAKRSPHSNRVSDCAADETGAATVLAAMLIAALTSMVVGGFWLASAVIARHRAQTAADLAALSAAARLPAGPIAACAEADALGTAMGAGVLGCAIEDLDVTVTIAVSAGLRFLGEAQASARAGPVTPG